MKTIPASLLLGALVFTACSRPASVDATPAPVAAATRVAAAAPEEVPPAPPVPRPSVADRIVEWKMRPADMQDEMDHERRVTRLRPPTDPLPQYARAEAMAAYLTQRLRDDPVVGRLNIQVNVERVVATLVGQADSLELVGRAMAVVLDTPRISEVISELELPAPAAAGPAGPMPHG